MDTPTISDLVGSSRYEAVADDSLKDEDNAAWVMTLESHEQTEWIERIRWIRLVDRLAENELIHSGSSEFHKFYTGWEKLLKQGWIDPDHPYREVLTSIRHRWFGPFATAGDRLSVQSWDGFLAATARYHKPDLVIGTLKEYQEMMETLSGSCFQTLPFLGESHWQIARSFGALDQFLNNLRDMREDAERGICYLPAELLERFGVSRNEILQLTACQNPNYSTMMQFWLDDYLPVFHQKMDDLLAARDLHPSWRIWRDWSFYRYRRIERVFRSCHFDYVQFPQIYWAEVRKDLPLLLSQVRQDHRHPLGIPPCQSLQIQEELTVPSLILELGEKAVRAMELVREIFQPQPGNRIRSSELC